jgi:dUTPase
LAKLYELLKETELAHQTYQKGMKIAQAVLCPVINGKWVNLVKVSSVEEKDRGDNGFGSTGII